MATVTKQPTLKDMEDVLSAALCWECGVSDCHELTLDRIEVCPELPFWEGRPVTRPMLLAWRELVAAQKKP
jgi:hypothetical protein